jgi:putative ABC transport system permease protein
MRGIEELGAARMLLLAPKVPERAEDQAAAPAPFTAADRDSLTRDVPHLAGVSLNASIGPREVTSDAGKTVRTDVVAADAAFFELYRMRVARGRGLTDADDRAAAPVCVVGPKLRENLRLEGALGHSLSFGSLRCRVVGELDENRRFGMNFGFDWSDVLVVPFGLGRAHDPETEKEATLTLVTDGASSNDVVKRVLNARLERRRHGVDDFTFYDLSGVVEKFRSTFFLMQVLVGLVAAIALVIGGVGVMNMMLVSVSERVAEIGVRKALGATADAIRAQFVVEATLLAGLGGGLGVAWGLAIAAALGALLAKALPTWVASVSVPSALVAFAASLVVGVAFGWIPAHRAARLSPVEAMRR